MNIPKVNKPSDNILKTVHSLSGEKGTIALIEADTGEYFLGKTLIEALKKAKIKFPDKIFYSVRIGYSYAHEHKGGITRI